MERPKGSLNKLIQSSGELRNGWVLQHHLMHVPVVILERKALFFLVNSDDVKCLLNGFFWNMCYDHFVAQN